MIRLSLFLSLSLSKILSPHVFLSNYILYIVWRSEKDFLHTQDEYRYYDSWHAFSQIPIQFENIFELGILQRWKIIVIYDVSVKENLIKIFDWMICVLYSVFLIVYEWSFWCMRVISPSVMWLFTLRHFCMRKMCLVSMKWAITHSQLIIRIFHTYGLKFWSIFSFDWW